MNKQIDTILNKEDPEVIKCVLLDLIQMDKKNEERVLLLYHKY